MKFDLALLPPQYLITKVKTDAATYIRRKEYFKRTIVWFEAILKITIFLMQTATVTKNNS